jgi:hypothetical protein
MDSMDINEGARVTVTCEGEVRRGEAHMCSPNKVSLLLRLDEALPGTHFYACYVPLLLKKDGLYHQVIGGQIVDIALTQ